MQREDALARANDWIDAWNAHDPDRVVAEFTDDVVVRSPVAAQLRPDSNGVLRGKEAVLSYYREGLAASPDLRFTLVDVCCGVDDVVIVYRNQRDVLVTETLRIGPDGRASQVSVAYAG